MVNQAVKQGVTNNVITARVSKNGNVNFKGNLKDNAVNPIIKVEMEDNKMVTQNKTLKILKCISKP